VELSIYFLLVNFVDPFLDGHQFGPFPVELSIHFSPPRDEDEESEIDEDREDFGEQCITINPNMNSSRQSRAIMRMDHCWKIQ
jgi:hypothetical protein